MVTRQQNRRYVECTTLVILVSCGEIGDAQGNKGSLLSNKAFIVPIKMNVWNNIQVCVISKIFALELSPVHVIIFIFKVGWAGMRKGRKGAWAERIAKNIEVSGQVKSCRTTTLDTKVRKAESDKHPTGSRKTDK